MSDVRVVPLYRMQRMDPAVDWPCDYIKALEAIYEGREVTRE